MNRRFFIPLFLLIIFSASAGEWYRSNAAGMPLEEIGGFRLDEFEWVLEIQKTDGDEERILYRNNEVYSERTRFFQDGQLVRETEREAGQENEYIYSDGLLREEIRRGSGPEEIRTYSYRGRMVERIEFFTDGELTYKDKYFLDSRGRLIRVQRSFPGEEVLTARYGYHAGELRREWHQDGSREELFLLEGGEIVGRSNWIDGELDASETWEEIDGERFLVLRYPGEERTIYRRFDEQERISLERIVTGEDSETLSYRYEGNDLVEKTIRGKGRKERWEFRWNDSELYSEKVFLNTTAVKKMVYPEDGIRWEVTYRNGEILATVIYENDIPVDTLFGEEPSGILPEESEPVGESSEKAGEPIRKTLSLGAVE